jgi:acyl-coenzyme A thioesterase PaaI-like protein
MSFRDVEQRMRDRHPDDAKLVPELEDADGDGAAYDFDAAEEAARKRRRGHGGWLLAAGLVAAAICVGRYIEATHGHRLVIDVRLLGIAMIGTVGGAIMLYVNRKRPLPKAVLRKP